jgi:hypothetical protein
MKQDFEVTEDRVEQWKTVYSIPALGISGSERSGLINNLANEVYRLRELIDNFCNSQSWADTTWKEQRGIRELFEEAERNKK